MLEPRKELLNEIEEMLFGLSVEELQRVASQCKLTTEDVDVEGKTRRALINYVMQFCEHEDLLELEDSGMSVLLALSDTVKSIKHKESAAKSVVAERSSPAEEEVVECSTAEGETAQQPQAREPVTFSRGRSPVVHAGRESMGSHSTSVWQAYRKDFKISGQIGEANQKDKLNFTSLEHQIENGLKKGYTDAEIVEAVIRAVSPGVKLRSYLEGKTDLTLATLRHILRAHYAEKDATDLYQQLTKAVQSPSETALDFVVRVLDLRQRVLNASE